MKICCRCNCEKPLSEFPKDRHIKSGYSGSCKTCHNVKNQLIRDSKEGLPSPTTQLRIQAVALLGGKCVVCGFNDFRALQIDHIDGGGCQEAKKLGEYNIYRQIVGGRTEGFQILCANHNWIKRYENQECYLNPGYLDIIQNLSGSPFQGLTD